MPHMRHKVRVRACMTHPRLLLPACCTDAVLQPFPGASHPYLHTVAARMAASPLPTPAHLPACLPARALTPAFPVLCVRAPGMRTLSCWTASTFQRRKTWRTCGRRALRSSQSLARRCRYHVATSTPSHTTGSRGGALMCACIWV
eukprot:361682-Chlamydomonas_euryale.AAC.5